MSSDITRSELEARLYEIPVRVDYDGTAYPPRPNARYVQWVGPVEPENALDNDSWVEV